jgi:putative membrane protein
MPVRDRARVFLKGVAMGSASAVPGISGGTVALLLGIYDRLISSVSRISTDWVLSVVKSLLYLDMEEFQRRFQEADGYFVATIAAGILTSLAGLFSIMGYLVSAAPVPVFGFFAGLILASVPVLSRDIEFDSWRAYLVSVTGFLSVLFLAGLGSSSLGHSLLVLFLSGMFAVSAMVLPGMSGSLLLVVLGQYAFISSSVSSLTESALSVSLDAGTVSSLLNLSAFGTGGLVGVFTVARIVEKALERSRNLTMILLVSMVAGAVRAPLIQVMENLEYTGPMSLVPPLAAFLAGSGAVLALDRKSNRSVG